MKKSTGIIIVALIESATLIINTCITSKISYNEGYKQAQADAQNETSILSQSVNEVDSQAQSSFESEISQLQQNEYSEYQQISENSSVKQNNVYKENSIDDNSSENISSVDNSDTDTTIPSLIGVSWSDEDRYELFSGNGNNGFIMFGKTYTNGFTISMGASYNIWGNGTQYVTYNIESISKMYSTITVLAGHIDGYVSDSILVQILLDKTIDDNPDYEYTINPTVSPKNLSIDIKGKSSMTIKVSNNGGSDNKIGFANLSFK